MEMAYFIYLNWSIPVIGKLTTKILCPLQNTPPQLPLNPPSSHSVSGGSVHSETPRYLEILQDDSDELVRETARSAVIRHARFIIYTFGYCYGKKDMNVSQFIVFTNDKLVFADKCMTKIRVFL